MLTKRTLNSKLFEKFSRSVYLRTDIRINFENQYQSKLFWHIFTSREYFQFVNDFRKTLPKCNRIIDAGASIGFFTLFIEHIMRLGLLEINNEMKYYLFEPGNCYSTLTKNLSANLPTERYKSFKNIIGKKSGSEVFYMAQGNPWGSSYLKSKSGLRKQGSKIDYYNLTDLICKRDVFLKIDIEGGEFDFIEHYRNILPNLNGILIEWHNELGDVGRAKEILNEYFQKSTVDWQEGNRIVEFYIRKNESILQI